MTLVLDSGALIGLERNDRAMWRRLKTALLGGSVPVCHAGVLGQAWRGQGPRQALLVKALAAKRRDVLDAALVLLASDGDHIVTSDADDLEPLARASGRHVEIIRV